MGLGGPSGALFDAAQDPTFELLPGAVGNLGKPYANPAIPVGPGDLTLRFDRRFRSRQRKVKFRDGLLRNPALHMNCHSAFAQVGCGHLHRRSLPEVQEDWHLDRTAEVAAPLALHETKRSIETTQRGRSGERLLQYEIRAHLKRLLG